VKEKILIVEDDDAKREVLSEVLDREGYAVTAVPDAIMGLAVLESGTFEVILSDLRMPDMDGIAFLKEVRKRSPEIPMLIMTAYGSIPSSVEAMRGGAFDYLTKPFTMEVLRDRLAKAIRQGRRRTGRWGASDGEAAATRLGAAIGGSEAMQRVFRVLQTMADSASTVLLQGESGTGKNLVARVLHDQSLRSAGPFVSVNCAVLNPELMGSELFGHEAGAFTGAVRQKKGRFELADGGTIFLDDVDDIPLETQVKLLNVLQERRFERVGGERTLEVDVRTLCATKRPLKDLVARGAFREDLYYRLSVVPIELPPLRDRREDIPLLASHFLDRLCSERGCRVCRVSDEVHEVLIRHDWPGNVRELENAMEFGFNFCRDGTITIPDLPPYLTEVDRGLPIDPERAGEEGGIDLNELLGRYELGVLRWAYRKAKGNCSVMARILKVPRTTLRDRMKKFGFPGERAQTDPHGGSAVSS
jgi:DNA-binding NtrC family response regulator